MKPLPKASRMLAAATLGTAMAVFAVTVQAQTAPPGLPREGGLEVPASLRVTIAGAARLGRANAPITIVEFSNYQCIACQRAIINLFPHIKRDYIDTGRARYVFLDLPLPKENPQARKAAEAVHCSAEQGKFLPMRDALFAMEGKLDAAQFGAVARKLGMNGVNFDRCLSNNKYAARINRSEASAAAIDIDSAPSFIIAKTERGDIVNGGMIINGVDRYDELRKFIEEVIKAK
ncbi:MAG: DsbA family protein [Burkholderiales bacterium]